MTKSKVSLRRERTTLEWMLLVISSVAIIAIAASLIFYGFSATSESPDLRLTLRPDGPAFVLEVENRGGTTAEEVVIEVMRGDERQELEFKAVAKGDLEEATVSIAGDGSPVARVKAYKEP